MTEPLAPSMRLPADARTGFMVDAQYQTLPTEAQHYLPADIQSPVWVTQFLALGDILSHRGRSAWNTLLEGQNLFYLGWTKFLLNLSPELWEHHYKIRFPQAVLPEKQILQQLDPILFKIPDVIWHMVSTIFREDRKNELLATIGAQWCSLPKHVLDQLGCAIRIPRSSPAEKAPAQALDESGPSLSPSSSQSDAALVKAKKSPKSLSSGRRRPSTARTARSEDRQSSENDSEDRYYCPEPYCTHKPDGFTKRGYCVNHVRNQHRAFTAQQSEWESLIIVRACSSEDGSKKSSGRSHKRARTMTNPKLPANTSGAISGVGDSFTSHSPVSSLGGNGISPRISLPDQYMQIPRFDLPLFWDKLPRPSTPANQLQFDSSDPTSSEYGGSGLPQSTPDIRVTPSPSPRQRSEQVPDTGHLGIRNNPNFGPWHHQYYGPTEG